MKRLAVVADNPLIVGAICSALRENGAFKLLGHADPRRATAATIMRVRTDVVLVDEADNSQPAIALIRSLREQDQNVKIIVLTLHMEGDWLEQAFEAGANGAMSKAIHPVALGTLVREAVNGHIVHSPACIRSAGDRAPFELAANHSSLTDRELEILRLVASGLTNGEIARQLWITQQTVKFHVSNIFRKLDVANRTEACHYAHINGLIAPGEPPVGAAERARMLAVAS